MFLLRNGAIIHNFLGNEHTFRASVKKCFAGLDADRDGYISFAEMARELMSLRMLKTSLGVDGIALSHVEFRELHRDIFAGFDREGNSVVGLEEFEEEMRVMLKAVAGCLSLSEEKQKRAKI
ncbi:hypothetical protein HPP92_007248 [Vanilla planifolia]|uniref:EF-hand domain-containing protein n=1 Tax=Vanilla planifolia TaxID=51239 RepID=A0A835RDQ4_VANPL|nr:hypothetical protein HPP92_007478 [Vanilla planifolia]KAG0490385.1 hypothetical protein HPP92_007248 [Vanilla planifolia]